MRNPRSVGVRVAGSGEAQLAPGRASERTNLGISADGAEPAFRERRRTIAPLGNVARLQAWRGGSPKDGCSPRAIWASLPMSAVHDASSVLRTMFETYRMLGQDHDVELERLARTGHRVAKPRAPRRVKRRGRRLPLAFRFAVTKLKALAG